MDEFKQNYKNQQSKIGIKMNTNKIDAYFKNYRSNDEFRKILINESANISAKFYHHIMISSY